MRQIKEAVIKYWVNEDWHHLHEVEFCEVPSMCDMLNAIDQVVFRHNLHTAMVSLGESYARCS